ncbi:lysophospholipid acyltransferase family protein [Caulobacter henricii]|uniref:Acyltransferase n=1 Tax=Caulobacter henricii TaxID=69395 RepID=A0A0P0NZY4_9CAUL|nr:lysophospholipid acyltransferase family protein [Caulobacter henricii]ALL13473.1 acyltransferase [Caulobacter henricii]
MSPIARLVKWALATYFRLQGWSVEGQAPASRKFVVIAAPHTSNWDFVYFIGAADALHLNLSFMGKASLFRWPFAGIMRDLGGVPIDRSQSRDTVSVMAEEFSRRDEFMLTIAPEGTRGKARQWKTGFYNIALKAGVPMVCGMMDYRRKVVSLGEAIMASGDYEKDMVKLAAIYQSCSPKYPERATTFQG